MVTNSSIRSRFISFRLEYARSLMKRSPVIISWRLSTLVSPEGTESSSYIKRVDTIRFDSYEAHFPSAEANRTESLRLDSSFSIKKVNSRVLSIGKKGKLVIFTGVSGKQIRAY